MIMHSIATQLNYKGMPLGSLHPMVILSITSQLDCKGTPLLRYAFMRF